MQALLSDGAAWSTSALALALGVSQRTIQRALAALHDDGRVRSLGRAPDVRRIDLDSGEVLERFDAPAGVVIAGLAHDGERFVCGAGSSGKVRTIQPPKAT